MQSPHAHQLAHEAEEYPAMQQSTTDIRIVPLPKGQDVLTEILRDGARRLLTEAIEAEVTAWIDAHAHLKDAAGPARSRSSNPESTTDGPRRNGSSSPPPSCPPTCGGPRAWMR